MEWERLGFSPRKLGDIKGTFHARMSMIKGRNSKDLTEAEDTKKCKNTQKNYKSLGEGS